MKAKPLMSDNSGDTQPVKSPKRGTTMVQKDVAIPEIQPLHPHHHPPIRVTITITEDVGIWVLWITKIQTQNVSDIAH